MHIIIGFAILVAVFALFPRVALTFAALGAMGVIGFFLAIRLFG